MANLTKLQQAVEKFRGLDKDIPFSVIVVFLEIAAHPDIELADLRERTGVSPQSMTRAITYLGESHWSPTSGKPGLFLATRGYHETDRRKKIIRLTPQGEAFAAMLEDIIK